VSRLVFLALLTLALAGPAHAEHCGPPSDPRGRVEIGATLGTLVPEPQGSFTDSLAVMGLVLGIPAGLFSLQLRGSLGSARDRKVYLVVAGLGLHIPTPFIGGFAFLGGHWLEHSVPGRIDGGFGPTGELGLDALFHETLLVRFGIQCHVRSRPVLGVSGGLSALL